MRKYNTIDEAILRIEELEKELYETELKLCEFDIEKNEYIKKYVKTDRERVQLLNEAVKLRVDLIDVAYAYNEMKNSNLWKKTKIIRNGINRLRSIVKRQPYISQEDEIIPEDKEETVVQNKQAEIPLAEEKTIVKKYEENIDFSSLFTDIKPVVFYCGDNSVSCDTMENQVVLAKQHGVYGFAVDYNWNPASSEGSAAMDSLLTCKENFSFMAVWSNNTAYEELSEDDARKFLTDIRKYVTAPGYIRVADKPVICVNNPHNIANMRKVFKNWKKYAGEILGTEIIIWVSVNDITKSPADWVKYADGVYQLPSCVTESLADSEIQEEVSVWNYTKQVEAERHFSQGDYKIPVFRTSMIKWCEEPEENSDSANTDCSVEKFYIWNCINTAYTRQNIEPEKRFVFIDGWNNYNKGSYLEPDTENGYAVLNALSKAIYNLPFDVKDFKKFDEIGFWKASLTDEDVFYTGGDLAKTVLKDWDTHLKKDTRIAIQAHVFYPELIADTCEYLANIPYAYDLYITTNEKYKATYIKEYLKENSTASKYFVEVVANKGRDVMPFIMQMKDHINQYDYICHIHTKKSLHNDVGDIWRKYLYDNLIGSPEIIRQIFYIFESQQDIGVIFPENMADLRIHMVWGENKQYGEWLFNKMNMEERHFVEEIIFPAGNMFWARTDAVRNVFEIKYKDSDFPEERGQVDGTIMHAIERIWLFVAEENGFKYQIVRNILDDVELFNE